ncbi:hypothetical protein AX14_004084 [Amanita brunnescens Koide BX004]|nr:hypothetical protein AX14_004084 [Amanita brunnescens Koide BX004]
MDGEPKSYIGVACWYYGTSLLDPFFRFREIATSSGSKDLVPFFFDGSDQMSLPDVYEAFALRHLPVSLETLQSDSDFVSLDAPYNLAGNVFNVGDLIERKFFRSIEDGGEVVPNSFTTFKAGHRTVVMASTPDPRGRMASISVTGFTHKLLDEAEKQAKELANMMKAHNGRRASFEIWPFHKNSFNGIKQEDCAWPHEEGKVFGPLIGWFEWSGRENDGFWLAAIRNALSELQGVAVSEGCATDDLPIYLNIALEDTPVEHIYRSNYDELKGLRQKYDPDNVMGQAVGFII